MIVATACSTTKCKIPVLFKFKDKIQAMRFE